MENLKVIYQISINTLARSKLSTQCVENLKNIGFAVLSVFSQHGAIQSSRLSRVLNVVGAIMQ